MSPDQKGRIIASEDIEEIERWQIPSVGSADHPAGILTAKQIEELQEQAFQQAYQEGFDKGHAEGLEAGQKEMQENIQLYKQLMSSLSTPFHELDEEVVKELVQLSMDMTRQLVRREIINEPGELIAVVREAITALPMASRRIKLYLHPSDSNLIKDALNMDSGSEHWEIVEDPALTRGGCRVVTEDSNVDATVETRMAAIFARVIGGERETDES